MFLVDSHCHLDLLSPEQGTIDAIVKRAQANGVHYLLNVCVKLSDFPTILKTSEAFTFVSTSVGLHPNDTDEETTEAQLIEMGKHPKVIAIGETGLDYYRSTGDLKWQHDRFRAHIRAARKLNKPLIIHTRDAKADTIRIMQEEGAEHAGGVIHCFTEDWEMAKAALDMNFYVSFSGIVTFKNATVIQEVAKQLPLNRMLIETDSPYLAPVPYRGKSNEPAYVRYTADYLANSRGISLAELAEMTSNNFFTLFKGAVRPHV